MITLEQAKEIAKQIMPKLDEWAIEPKAFIFRNSKAEGNEKWDNEVVVLKADGRIVSYMEYVMEIADKK